MSSICTNIWHQVLPDGLASSRVFGVGVNVAFRRAKAACRIEEEHQLSSKQPLKAKHIVISSHVEHCLTFPQGG